MGSRGAVVALRGVDRALGLEDRRPAGCRGRVALRAELRALAARRAFAIACAAGRATSGGWTVANPFVRGQDATADGGIGYLPELRPLFKQVIQLVGGHTVALTHFPKRGATAKTLLFGQIPNFGLELVSRRSGLDGRVTCNRR